MNRIPAIALIGTFACVTTSDFHDYQKQTDRRLNATPPVGTIVMTTLSKEKFQRGQAAETEWVLCDGAAYPDSKWANVAGNPIVPNMSTRYPRGAGVDLKPGDTQEDAVQIHTHLLVGNAPGDVGNGETDRWDIMRDAKGDGGNNHVLRWGYKDASHTMPTNAPQGARVAEETRPKTLVVNFFIRIN